MACGGQRRRTDEYQHANFCPDIGLLLPCNVVVREEADGTITVVFMDTDVVLKLVDKPEVHALGKEVKVMLQRVCASLTT